MPRAGRTKDFVTQVILTFIGIVVVSLPTDFYLFLLYLLEPHGFWQNLILVGFGVYFLGVFQFIFFVAFIWWLFVVWSELFG